MHRHFRVLVVIFATALAGADSIGVGNTFAIVEKAHFMKSHVPVHRLLKPAAQLHGSQFRERTLMIRQHDMIFLVKIPEYRTEQPFSNPTKGPTWKRAVNALFWKNTDRCQKTYTRSCEKAVANPNYRPTNK